MSRETKALQGLRVLLVDDDDLARAVVSDMLAYLGACVRSESSAHCAMDALRRQPFDVLLCDVDMPRITGHQLLQVASRHARGDGAPNRIPAIGLTRCDDSRSRSEAYATAFSRHLAKPLSLQCLVNGILSVSRP